MENNCLNCNHLILENFCGNCGQKKYKRIDKKYIWDEVQYTVLHTNKGFLYTLKNLLKNPGKCARGFIEGNRVNHYKPILLVFVLSGISTFLSFKVLGMGKMMQSFYDKKELSSPMMNDVMSFITSYSSLLMLLLLPIFAFFTKVAFRKWGHNYYEHVVMNSFILAVFNIACVVLVYPIIYLEKDDEQSVVFYSSLSMLTVPFILVWFFKGFYPSKTLMTIILRVLLIVLMVMFGYVLAVILGIIIMLLYTMIVGPEALEYLKPRNSI